MSAGASCPLNRQTGPAFRLRKSVYDTGLLITGMKATADGGVVGCGRYTEMRTNAGWPA